MVVMPQAALHCPGVAGYDKFGTINIELNQAIEKSRADCWTPKITWDPLTLNQPHRREAFGFTRIRFEFPLDAEAYEAWIVFPESHPFSYGGNGVEVIAAVRIPGMERGKVCAIQFDHVPLEPRPPWFGELYGMR
jgi:hypothetical protein